MMRMTAADVTVLAADLLHQCRVLLSQQSIMGRRGGSSSSIGALVFPVVLGCLAALMLSSALIYLYLDSVLQSSEDLVKTHTGCPSEHFQLPDMKACSPWLRCSQIKAEVRRIKPIGQGAVKKVYLAEWRGHKVAVSELASPEYREDFLHGLSMLQALQGPLVVQLVGFCLDRDTVVAQHHPHGSLLNLEAVLARQKYQHLNTWHIRLRLATDYVSILHFLHNSPAGRRVMCDSNSLEKTLSQFLLTNDFHLVANDLDALPEARPSGGASVKCGRRELAGEFVAPEQLWPFGSGRPFSDHLMPPYDEKTDIWKIPDLTRFIMGRTPEGDLVHFHLFQIHKECKDVDPKRRPSALDVLKAYKSVYGAIVRETSGYRDML